MTLRSHQSTPDLLQRSVQLGLLTLLAFMPFHAFLTVWLGTTFGHRTLIQSWKEILLLLLGALTLWLVIQQPERLRRLRQPGWLALLSFALLALIVTAITRPPALVALFGLKTDLEFIAAGTIGLLVGTLTFLRRAVTVTLIAASGVVAFGLAQAWLLPADFLTHFGYGPSTIAPYQILDPAIDSLRFAATLGGPNQLGSYLIIIIALAITTVWSRRRWPALLLITGSFIVLFHTYSRAAWIGALLATIIAFIGSLPRRWQPWGIAGVGTGGLAAIAALPLLLSHDRWQRYFLHGVDQFHHQRGSDYEHLASLQTGSGALLGQPWGHGLGTAGPTVFHTGTGRIIENFYLQLGYEAGLLGMILFIVAIGLIAWQLLRHTRDRPIGLALGAALLGLSVNALVLPAWTDSTTALTFWILTGLALAPPKQDLSHV